MAKKKSKSAAKSGFGSLVIIGGHEDRRGDMKILREVVRLNGAGKLVVTTVASRSAAKELWEEYRKAFRKLGIKNVVHLDLAERAQSITSKQITLLHKARTVFFTGGDQLRITATIGGTPILDAIWKVFMDGGTIAGTSAGASAVSQTMLLSGQSGETPRLDNMLGMAPGLGFLRNTIVDQHFAERGRIGRLLGAIALNPTDLGLGVDENTAIVIEDGRTGKVIGEGGVYVVDATRSTDSNVSDGGRRGALSLFNISLHVLSDGDSLDLSTRTAFKGHPV